MNCKEVSRILSDYLDGSLSEQAKRELELHLAECPNCELEVESTKKLVSSLGSLSIEKSPVDCWDEVYASIRLNERHKAAWWHWMLKPIIAAPTAAAMALLTLFLMWPSSYVPQASDKDYASEYNYYIGAHSRLQRQQSFTDPDVAFVRAELQKATLSDGTE